MRKKITSPIMLAVVLAALLLDGEVMTISEEVVLGSEQPVIVTFSQS